MSKSTENVRVTLRTSEAAAALGIGRTKFQHLLKVGAIPAKRCGGSLLVRLDDLHTFAANLPDARPAPRAAR